MNYKLSIILIFCSTLLTGCFGYPRLLSYPFDSGGRSLNSFSSELNPQISGRYIVFTSDRRGSQDVYMFDTLTRNLIDLPGLNSFDTIASHPAASDNGKFIVFAASRQGRTHQEKYAILPLVLMVVESRLSIVIMDNGMFWFMTALGEN